MARSAISPATAAPAIGPYSPALRVRNLLFLSGQMSPRMRQILLDHLNAMPNDNSGRDRVQEALYLITNSPEYTVQK